MVRPAGASARATDVNVIAATIAVAIARFMMTSPRCFRAEA
jgi:hypothetical protein